jgi:hypothetical protein
MLKFESLAKIGDVIKAFDFKPMADRPDYFLTGIVTEKGPMYKEIEEGRKVYIGEGYTVNVIGGDAESVEMGRKNVTMYVPFEVDFMEYNERIELVATKEELEMITEEYASVF